MKVFNKNFGKIELHSKLECGSKCPGTTKCKGCPDKSEVIKDIKNIYTRNA